MAADLVLDVPELGLCLAQFAQLRRIQVEDALVVSDDLVILRLDSREHLVLRLHHAATGLARGLKLLDLFGQAAAALLRGNIVAGRLHRPQPRILGSEG
jgi:hypothetical protein